MSKKIFKPFKKLFKAAIIPGAALGAVSKAVGGKKKESIPAAPLNPLVSPEENKKKTTRRNQAARQQIGAQQTILSDTLGG
jgi:hypothetical protein